jgi:DNA repair protein SbcC/Rad50
MIKSIQLQNFQNHVDSTLKITEGVNALIGATDSGKTAIIRALRWVVFNRPSVSQFINHQAMKNGKQVKPVRVTVETDKHVIVRESSATTNSYILDGVVYNAVNKDIPEEVIQALDFNELNIQFQLDSPFLLTETSGEVARMLNKIVKLEDIDSTLRNIESYRRKLLRNKENLIAQTDELREEIDSINLDDITSTLEMAELLDERQNALLNKIQQLQELISSLREIEEILATEQMICTMEDLLNLLLSTVTTLNTIQEKINTLSILVQNYEEINTYIEAHAWLFTIHIEVIDSLLEEVTSYKRAIQTLQVLQKTYKDIKDLGIAFVDIHDIDQTHTIALQLKKQLVDLGVYLDALEGLTKDTDTLEQEIHEITLSLGEVCPLCGSKL